MMELGKYGIYVISAYGITLGILLFISIQTLIDFTKTKNKLETISQKSS